MEKLHSIVNGGAGGIGAPVVAELVRRGHAVTVFDLREPHAVDVLGLVVDVTDEEAVEADVVRRLRCEPGSIVIVSSTTAYGGWAKQADYGPAKAAERQLTANLAIEWAPLGVRANAVAPGHTITPMVQDLIDKDDYDVRGVRRRMPLGRFGRPGEIADAIAWLLCDATFVTGQCLPVDGGWTALGK